MISETFTCLFVYFLFKSGRENINLFVVVDFLMEVSSCAVPEAEEQSELSYHLLCTGYSLTQIIPFPHCRWAVNAVIPCCVVFPLSVSTSWGVLSLSPQQTAHCFHLLCVIIADDFKIHLSPPLWKYCDQLNLQILFFRTKVLCF